MRDQVHNGNLGSRLAKSLSLYCCVFTKCIHYLDGSIETVWELHTLIVMKSSLHPIYLSIHPTTQMFHSQPVYNWDIK